ncbi:hypothetical protein ONS95_014174 [Cadophora gregata]|uniref:uncharacterized protein n=1 Tax=Cadophora gregata TaxID=51156 RepID=UPI0026DB9146|nr:uncharacterized protein ONS95_014174 [Cadophora gregata]KAK0114689.1 hypothetical protein ONS95_014174 [Cadophora gregata]
MSKYSTEWFGLKLVSEREDADIAIADESAYLNEAVSDTEYGILLILCSSGARRDIFPSRLHTGQIVEFISKPCGPHRLAKALLNCLDTEDGTPHTPNDERSSIGFSPTVLNLIRTPSLSKTITLALSTEPVSPTPTPLHERRAASANAATALIESGNISETMSLASKPSMNKDTPQTPPTAKLPKFGKSNLEDLKPRSPDAVPAARRKPTMLLVEDNPVNMMLLATYMKKNKWEFEKASNGLLALEAFRERPGGFDVIFMDVSMPVMTGYESTRHIRMIETERRLAYEHQNLIQTSPPFLSPSSTTAINMQQPSSFPFNLPTPGPTPSTSNSSHLPLRSDSISPTNTSSLPSNPTTFPFPASSSSTPPNPNSNHNNTFPSSRSSPPSTFSPPPLSDLNARLVLPRLKLNSPALIIALTGFSSQKDQEMAFEAGVDIFMTKPVRFKEVGRILEGWMRGREGDEIRGEEEEGASGVGVGVGQ